MEFLIISILFAFLCFILGVTIGFSGDNIKNISEIPGYETIQIYSSDLFASITPDIKRLRRFSKVFLKGGEEKTIKFTLPINDLAFVNYNNEYVVEPGKFKISISDLSQEIIVN